MDGPKPPQSSVERGRALIAAAIVAAALILSWAMPGPPRYQIAASGAGVARLDTDSGELIACDMRQCARIQEPDRAKSLRLFDGGASKTQPALPPPANSFGG